MQLAQALGQSSAAEDARLQAKELLKPVREYWLVHPTDRTVVVYTLLDGDFGRPQIHEMNGTLSSTVLPELTINWSTTHSS